MAKVDTKIHAGGLILLRRRVFGCPSKPNTTKQVEHNTEPKHTCQKYGKINKERRAHDERDECDEPIDDSIYEH